MSKDYDQALRECISKCPPDTDNPAELIEYGFGCGYMAGYSNGYRVGYIPQYTDTLRLKVATAAMQGLLAGGYLAEHSDTAAEAVRQADALLSKIKAS